MMRQTTISFRVFMWMEMIISCQCNYAAIWTHCWAEQVGWSLNHNVRHGGERDLHFYYADESWGAVPEVCLGLPRLLVKLPLPAKTAK